jgi:hypothetical protein
MVPRATDCTQLEPEYSYCENLTCVFKNYIPFISKLCQPLIYFFIYLLNLYNPLKWHDFCIIYFVHE